MDIDAKGQTALTIACGYGHTDIVSLLLDANADISIRTRVNASDHFYLLVR